jgi:hypothetical protein
VGDFKRFYEDNGANGPIDPTRQPLDDIDLLTYTTKEELVSLRMKLGAEARLTQDFDQGQIIAGNIEKVNKALAAL